MMTPAEATLAYRDARRLARLYDAYRASSRAHVLAVRRMMSALKDASIPEPRRIAIATELQRQEALAEANDWAFYARGEDVRRRITELADFSG